VGTGAVVNNPGSCACDACATIRAIGLRPSFAAVLARISTSAAAPSEIDEELAAVTVPSLAKAGLSVGILSKRALPGCSSSRTTTSPPRSCTVTGAISRLNAPLVIASCARFKDCTAYAS
jgi:hypothetical protein